MINTWPETLQLRVDLAARLSLAQLAERADLPGLVLWAEPIDLFIICVVK